MRLAGYACDPNQSRGRIFKEKKKDAPNYFCIDKERIIYGITSCLLESKTQTIPIVNYGMARNGLIHCLKMSYVAGTISDNLLLNRELVETVVIARCLGKPPFGILGRVALNDALSKHNLTFDERAQSLRVVAILEDRYMSFKGMNLAYETLSGLAPMVGNGQLECALEHYADWHLISQPYRHGESQVSDIAETITRLLFDIEDGFRCGFFTFEQLFEIPLYGIALKQIMSELTELRANRLDQENLVFMTSQKITHVMSHDIIRHSAAEIKRLGISTPQEISDAAIVGFSHKMTVSTENINSYLETNLYAHRTINDEKQKINKMISSLFEFFYNKPQNLDSKWQKRYSMSRSDNEAVLVISDFISSICDESVIKMYNKYVGSI